MGLVLGGGLVLSLAARADPPDTLPPVEAPAPEPAGPDAAENRDPTAATSVVKPPSKGEPSADVGQVLRRSGAVVVQERGGPLQSSSLSVRGSAPSGVLVLLDGVPLNGAGGVFDPSTLSSGSISRIEVVRGGGGFGQGALAGAVNVISKDARATPSADAKVSYGSFATLLSSLTATGALGPGAGLFSAHFGHSDGDFPWLYQPTPELPGQTQLRTRANNDVTQGGALARYRLETGPGRVEALVQLDDGARGLAGTAQNPTPGAREDELRATATVRYLRPWGQGEVAVRGYGRQVGRTLSGLGVGDGTQVERSAGIDGELSQLWGRHGAQLRVLAGADAVAFVDSERARPFASVRAQDRILFRDGAVQLVPAFGVGRTGTFTQLAPELGASWELSAVARLRANLGRTERAPSFIELYERTGTLLPNPDLRPEHAWHADLGAEVGTRAFVARATLFGALYQDLISYEYYPPQLAKPFNFDAALAAGTELEASLEPSTWWRLFASYTLTHSADLRDDPRYYGRPLPWRPLHQLRSALEGGPAWARGRLSLELDSTRFANRGATLYVPARTTVDASMTSALGQWRALALGVEVRNVLDAQSWDFDGYPLPGRAVFVTVSGGLEPAPKPVTP